jgi:hypothetical protein
MRQALRNSRRTKGNQKFFEALEPRQLLTIITVTNVLDSGLGSLRAAIAQANQDSTADTIQFDSIVFASKKTITPITALPTITQPVSIQGPGTGLLTISGGNKLRIFDIGDGLGTKIVVGISGLTLTAGKTAGDGGAIYNEEDLTLANVVVSKNTAAINGGGVYCPGGNLTVQNSTFAGNSASGSDFENGGGGIFQSGGDLTIEDSVFTSNKATRDGGGIRFEGSGGMLLTRVKFESNTAVDDGAGVFCTVMQGGATWDQLQFISNKASDTGGGAFIEESGPVTVTNSLFSKNSAVDDGAGMYAYLTNVTIQDSQFLSNAAKSAGGGVFFPSGNYPCTLERVELSQNSASDGGGIYTANNLNLFNSALIGNKASSDGGGMFVNGDLLMVNTTVANNTAKAWGGGILIFESGDATVRNSTIALNTAGTGKGGGIANYIGDLRMDSSIFSGNKKGGNKVSDIESNTEIDPLSSNNLIGDPNVNVGLAIPLPTNTGNLIGVNPLLLPLGNYGGSTPTFGIAIGGPAINAGNNLENMTTDQRGTPFGRVFGGTADIGAFENEFADKAAQISVIAGKPQTYKDANGNDMVVTVTGTGSAQLIFDTALPNANPSAIYVYNTDSKSKVTITPKVKGTHTTVGNITVYESLGEFNGATVDLGGSMHIFGTPGKLVLGDVKDDHQILIDGEGMTNKSAVSITLGEVAETSITSAVPISQLQVIRWDDNGGSVDTVTAPRLDKLTVTGVKNGVAGDFEAALTITGVGQTAGKAVLGTVSIAGTLGGGAGQRTWAITGGVTSVTAAKILNVDINTSGSLTTLTVKPAAGVLSAVFINSNVTVQGKLTTAKLGKVQTDNADTIFGVSAHELTTLEYFNALGTKVTVNKQNPPPKVDDDFRISLIV